MKNLEDKTFELLTQMYVELKPLKSNVIKIGIKLENDTDRKLDILLETRDEVNKRLDDIDKKLDDISLKVEKQDVEIKVIKGAK